MRFFRYNTPSHVSASTMTFLSRYSLTRQQHQRSTAKEMEAALGFMMDDEFPMVDDDEYGLPPGDM